ncbi:hypothetical protein ACYZX9_11370 [Sphingomonas citri]
MTEPDPASQGESGGIDTPSSLRFLISRGDRFDRAGKIWVFDNLVGDLWIFRCGKEILQVARESDGLLAHPVERDVARMIRERELNLLSRPLRDAVRRRARAREATRAEVVARDPVAVLRMEVCLWVDRVDPKRDDENLKEIFKRDFDEQATRATFDTWPSPATIRSWANRRGRKFDRRWADMEATPGQGERAKRVVGLRYELALWHATRIFSKKGARLTPAGAHRALRRDVKRLNRGDPLKMDSFQGARTIPETIVAPLNRTGFYDLCKQLESARNERHRTTSAAVRSRREGGGRSYEPIRFMSHVQMDETEVGAFFFIDERRRVPLGSAVSTIAVCCHSGAVVGFDLGWEAGSTSSWLRTVLNMASLKDVPEEFRADFGDLEYMGGMASAMVFDNARHYAGIAVQDAGGDLVCDTLLAGEGEPTHKGFVERTHDTLFQTVTRLLPARKLPIRLVREWDIDMAGRPACSLQLFRNHWWKAICLHNTTPKRSLDDRSPIQVMREDRARFGYAMPSDLAAFERAIANATYIRVLDKGGIVINGLRYIAARGTSKLLDDFVAASADRRRTKNLAFDAKIKVYDHAMSRVGIFNPYTSAFEDLECTRTLYAAGLTLQLHRIVQAIIGEKAMEHTPEEVLLEVRGQVEDAVENDFPEVMAKEDKIHSQILKDPRTLAIATDRLMPRFITPSPTGQEVQRDLAVGTRKDGGRLPPFGRRDRQPDDPLQELPHGTQVPPAPGVRVSSDRAQPTPSSAASSLYGGIEDLL